MQSDYQKNKRNEMMSSFDLNEHSEYNDRSILAMSQNNFRTT